MKQIDAAELKSYQGQELGVSEWFQIDQARINAFRDLSNSYTQIPAIKAIVHVGMKLKSHATSKRKAATP